MPQAPAVQGPSGPFGQEITILGLLGPCARELQAIRPHGLQIWGKPRGLWKDSHGFTILPQWLCREARLLARFLG